MVSYVYYGEQDNLSAEEVEQVDTFLTKNSLQGLTPLDASFGDFGICEVTGLGANTSVLTFANSN